MIRHIRRRLHHRKHGHQPHHTAHTYAPTPGHNGHETHHSAHHVAHDPAHPPRHQHTTHSYHPLVSEMQWHPHWPPELKKREKALEKVLRHFYKHHRKVALAGLAVLVFSILGGGGYTAHELIQTRKAKTPSIINPEGNNKLPLGQIENKVPNPNAGPQTETKVPKKHSDRVIHIKLQDDAEVDFENGQLVDFGSGLLDISKINDLIKSVGGGQVKNRLFHEDKSLLKNAREALKNEGYDDLADLSQYYRIVLDKDADTTSVSNALKAIPGVVEAYPEPEPAPAPSADYQSAQTYRSAAPTGVDFSFAATWPGGLGENVRIADLEYSWNTSHEDLSKARQSTSLIKNGTPTDPFNNTDHGTAVIGILSGDSNNYGVTGLVNKATLSLVNANSQENGWDVPGAIYLAANTLSPGDVLLIEQQAWGPTTDTYNYVPMEWVPAVYDAVKYAVAKGIIVVEAGGNGNQNLDNQTYYGTSFPSGKSDSGAIIVGAGAACPGSILRSRMWFSNYGTRINVQGWGECVTTTGYGDLSSASLNSYYTSAFSGTSSASPIVAAVAASFSSAFETANGRAPTPAEVRNALMSTGTAQNFASGSLSGSIGPLPNLANALKLTSSSSAVAVSVPGSFKVWLNSNKKPVIGWTASKSSAGIRQYNILRNGAFYRQVSGTTLSFTDTNVSRGKTYSYKVKAIDNSGRESAFTSTLSIKVP